MANTFKVGDSLKFKAYSQETPDGKMTAGETVKVVEVKEDESYIVENAGGHKEHLFFPDELEAVATTATRTRTKAAAPAADAKATKAGAKAGGKVKGAKTGKAATDKDAEKAKKTAEKEAAKKAREEEKAKKDAEKAAKKAEAEKPLVIVDTESVKAIIAEQGDALKAAGSLKGQIDETYFSLGGVLSHINHEGLYKSLGGKFAEDGGYKAYCEDVLEIGYSRAKYWEGIYLYFSGMGMDQEDLAGLGWSKAKELRDLTSDKAKLTEAVEYGRTHSKAEVIEWVAHFRKTDATAGEKGAARGATAEKSKSVKFNFSLTEAEAETATAAVTRAKELIGEADNENKAFLHIMTEWAMTVDGAEVSLADAVAAIEARFNTKLVEDLGNGKYATPGEAPAEAPAPAPAAPAAKKGGRGKKA